MGRDRSIAVSGIRELLRDADPRDVERYLNKGYLQDPDFQAMRESMINDGEGAYSAARLRSASGESSRSFPTLVYHAKSILSNIYEFFGEPVSEIISRLQNGEDVHVSYDQLPMLRQGCSEMDIEIIEDVRIRISTDDDS